MTRTAARFTWPARSASAEEVLRWGFAEFGPGIGICTSFQATGSVIVDMAAKIVGDGFRVFSIDTGRLHEETYELIDKFRNRYGVSVQMLSPDAAELGSMLTEHGPNLFYRDSARRKLCCEIRKIRPLKRRLATLDAWVTGLRRDQGQGRAHVDKVVVDEEHGGIVKLAPLADWTSERVFEYAERHDVPLHALYAKGYSSIGCQPCTRPVQNGDDPRSGRWWWEDDGDGECGMHVAPTGKLRREFDLLLDEILPARRPYVVQEAPAWDT